VATNVRPSHPVGPFRPLGPIATVVAFAAATLLTGAGPRPPLEVGPGSGFRTPTPALVRLLQPDISVQPILTVGDTLAPNDPEDYPYPYVFYPLPDGLGARAVGSGLVEVYVTHEIGWQDGVGGARVSRLVLDKKTAGVLAGDYFVDGTEGYSRLCTASLVGPRDGFLTPTFLINEESLLGVNHGIVAAVDARDGTVTRLPWLGRFSHEATIIVPTTSGGITAIATEDAVVPGESQLYMYRAETDSDFMAGRGQLYVFRAEIPTGAPRTRTAALLSKSRSVGGRFVPLYTAPGLADNRRPDELEQLSQRAGCLNFVRLEDAAPDRERSDSFYFIDTGNANFPDPVLGRPATSNGRLYRASLDPMDPTIVRRIDVVLDGDEEDDLYRPDNLDSNGDCIMIQEDPGGRGIHPARILRYDLRSRRLDAIAECAERDTRDRLLPRGTGGAWETTGILDVSEIFGDDVWLLAVQAHTLESLPFGGRGGGGQLLLLNGPASERARKDRKERAARAKREGGDNKK